jgi:hypothetical protein
MPKGVEQSKGVEQGRLRPPDLNNPQRYVRLHDVPLIDVHTRTFYRRNPHTGQNEEVTEEVDRAQLFRIFQNSLKRAKGGEYGLVFLGHTDDDGAEVDQPPIVGYVGGYKFGSHNGQPTILGDVFLDREFHPEELVRQFPRRSVEIVGKNKPTGFIDSLALLKRSPERDLGLITSIYRNKKRIDRYMCPECEKEAEGNMPAAAAMNPRSKMKQDVTKNMLDMFRNLIYMMLEEEMGGAPEMDAEAGMGGMEEGEGELEEDIGEAVEDLGEAEEDLGEVEEEGGEFEAMDEEEEDSDSYAAGAGFPGPTVGMPNQYKAQSSHIGATSEGVSQPGRQPKHHGATGTAQKMLSGDPAKRHLRHFKDTDVNRGTQARHAATTDVSRMRRDQDNIQVSRYARDIAQLQTTVKTLTAANAELAKERKKESIERRLIQLEAEGFIFDRPGHVERFMRFPEDTIEAELNVIRENYARSPVGQRVVLGLNDTIDVGRNGLPDTPAMPASQDEVMHRNNEQIFGSSVARFARDNKIDVEVDGVTRFNRKDSIPLGSMIERYRQSKKPKQTA